MDFRDVCRLNLAAQQMRRLKDWRLDYNLKQACSADAPTHCADALKETTEGKTQVCAHQLQDLRGRDTKRAGPRLRGCHTLSTAASRHCMPAGLRALAGAKDVIKVVHP